MTSANGRWVIAYNGELYNHLGLRSRVEESSNGNAWRGHSDSETLVGCLQAWGVHATLGELEGMFAFAAWDRERRELWLARDRFGEKPLYYGWLGDSIVFASQLCALRAHPAWTGDLDETAVAEYFRLGHVPQGRSIHAGIERLPPGHYLKLSAHAGIVDGPAPYWMPSSAVGIHRRDLRSPEALVDDLHEQLHAAVSERMLSDVPLGALLSGGIDSSAIVAAAQTAHSEPVQTFSVAFGESEYDESAFAARVARYLGTDHTELSVGADEALELVTDIPGIWDEPFADASQIPTCLISRKAREHVTVCLSGDGGDELFGGYTRYNQAVTAWRVFRALPRPVRLALGGWIQRRGSDRITRQLPKAFRVPQLRDRMHKIASCLEARDGDELYDRLTSTWFDPGDIVARPVAGLLRERHVPPAGLSLRERMMYRDLLEYLPDDLLVKTDRATMSVGLEARLPFLDPGIVEFAWQLPERYKVRRGEGKWLLRQLVRRHLPRELVDRPKQGFSVPIGEWLRGPLRSWADSLLDEDRLVAEGWLRADRVRRMWNEHRAGSNRWQQHLWTVLMFQAWLERYAVGTSSQPRAGVTSAATVP